MLCQMPKLHQKMVANIIQLIVYGKGSFYLSEDVEFLAIDADLNPVFTASARIPQPRDISTICSGLFLC